MASEKQLSRSLVVQSMPFAVEGVRDEILEGLKQSGFSEEDVFSVHLAVEEAFINAIDHGNDMDPDKNIEIQYKIESDHVEITVTDEGPGFDPNVVPDPRCGDNLYKANGRGLLLMRAYMDSVEFNETGNSVHMIRRKGSKKLGKGKQ